MNYDEWVNVCKEAKGKITDAKTVYAESIKLITDFQKEHFIAFYLNTKNKIIHSEVVSIGTLDSALIHPREIFKPAFIHSAHSIIIAHNHPSGDTTPSVEDNKITEQLKKAGELLNIQLLDHVIIGVDSWFSYDDRTMF